MKYSSLVTSHSSTLLKLDTRMWLSSPYTLTLSITYGHCLAPSQPTSLAASIRLATAIPDSFAENVITAELKESVPAAVQLLESPEQFSATARVNVSKDSPFAFACNQRGWDYSAIRVHRRCC